MDFGYQNPGRTTVPARIGTSNQKEAIGEPLQLIRFVKNSSASNGDKTVMEICSENLSNVLASVGKNPLCVITICGPSSQGKSFMLNHMIRCLTALENGSEDWMDWANPNKPLTGFHWKTSADPVTKGICIWSKPFTVKNVEGDDISVVLVDTQGTYDESTLTHEMASVVGISLLMSSVTVFNFFHNLQEDILNSLSSHVDFGLLTSESGENEEDTSPFRKLLFLIRDWNFPAEYDYGWDGGSKFIKTKFQVKESQPKEAQEIREHVGKCFQSLDCFLMPPIGESAKAANYNGNISGLGQLFSKHLRTFVTQLMSSKLEEKSILGTKITKENFHLYLDEYVKVFNESDAPSPRSILEATQQVVNNKAVGNSVKQYQIIMKRHQMGSQYLINAALQDAHTDAKVDALKMFKTEKKVGSSARLVKDFEEKLSQQIEDQFGIIQTQNVENKQNAITTAKNRAIDDFESSLHSEFPFENDAHFYEDGIIQEKSDEFKSTCFKAYNSLLLFMEGDEPDNSFRSPDIEIDVILKNLKTKNEENEKRVRDDLGCRVKELVEKYKDSCNSLLQDDSVVTVQMLHKGDTKFQEEIMNFFVSMENPGNKHLKEMFEKSFLTEINDHYNSHVLPKFKEKVEKMNAADNTLVKDLIQEYKDAVHQQLMS